MSTSQAPRDRAEVLAFLPTMSDATRYQEPKRGVMELLAKMRDDPGVESELVEAARVRPDIFDDEVVRVLVGAARVHAVSAAACGALEHVVRSRAAVPEHLEAQLMEMLDSGRLDAAAELATTCAELGSSHSDEVIRRLAVYVYERDSFAAMAAQPDWLSPLMRRLAKVNAPLLAELMALRLQDADGSARRGAATLAGELAVTHPEVAPTLRPAVLQSLELESSIFETPSLAAIDALAAMYIADPHATDEAIANFRSRATTEAKRRALEVYARALHMSLERVSMGELLDRARRGEPQRIVHAPDDLTGHVVDRVLALMKAESDLDTWRGGGEALDEAGSSGSTSVLRERLDRLLFTLLEAAELSAKPKPEIKLVGVPKKPPALMALERQADEIQWASVLRGISGAIAGAMRDGDPAAIGGIITAIEKLRAFDPDGWIRAELVKVLRVLIRTPMGRAQLVPLLYTYLMDGAVPVLVAALELCEELVKEHQDELPQLLLDTVSALVLNSYVYVGRAAVGVAEYVKPRSETFRRELVGRLVLRARAEGSAWDARLKAIAAAVQVAGDEDDLGARVVSSEGIRFFTEAPSLYGRNEIWRLRRFNGSSRHQLAVALCVVRHLERPMKPADEYAPGDAGDEIATLRRMDRALLEPLVESIHGAAMGLAAHYPSTAFDLTVVLADAGRPDLAESVCAAIVKQRRDTPQGRYIAHLAEAGLAYYQAEMALRNREPRAAETLFARSAELFEDERGH